MHALVSCMIHVRDVLLAIRGDVDKAYKGELFFLGVFPCLEQVVSTSAHALVSGNIVQSIAMLQWLMLYKLSRTFHLLFTFHELFTFHQLFHHVTQAMFTFHQLFTHFSSAFHALFICFSCTFQPRAQWAQCYLRLSDNCNCHCFFVAAVLVFLAAVIGLFGCCH